MHEDNVRKRGKLSADRSCSSVLYVTIQCVLPPSSVPLGTSLSLYPSVSSVLHLRRYLPPLPRRISLLLSLSPPLYQHCTKFTVISKLETVDHNHDDTTKTLMHRSKTELRTRTKCSPLFHSNFE